MASFGGGIVKGFCKERNIEISAGLEGILTYAMPLIGITAGFIKEYLPFSKGTTRSLADLLPFVTGGAGAAAGGLGAIVSEAGGYVVGCLAGKLFYGDIYEDNSLSRFLYPNE